MQCWLTCPMGVKSDLPVKSDPAVKSRDCNIFHIKKICKCIQSVIRHKQDKATKTVYNYIKARSIASSTSGTQRTENVR